jgi:large repetitive protein
VTNTCGAAGSQAGMLKTATDPTPATGSAKITSYVYDQWGRVAGTKVSGDSGWTCTHYDTRGRVDKQTYPDRTVVTTYAVGADPANGVLGDPLKSSVSDDSVSGSPNGGTITTVSDLLGRTLAYTDVWGVTTSTGYDAAGRAVSSTTTAGGQSYTVTNTLDADGRVLSVADGGNTLATTTYTGPDLTTVTYPAGTGAAGNGTSLSLGVDPAGARKSLRWTFPSSSVTDAVTRSQAGTILTDTLTDGATVYPASYGYDTVGRLISAAVPYENTPTTSHNLTYSYAGASTCAANPNAGMNGDRTQVSDASTGLSVGYCYDNADRLISTSPTSTGPIALSSLDVFNGTALSTTAGTLAYDAAGNTTTLAGQSLTFDSAGRHTSSHTTDSTVTYTRDATDRIVARTSSSVSSGGAPPGTASPVTATRRTCCSTPTTTSPRGCSPYRAACW